MTVSTAFSLSQRPLARVFVLAAIAFGAIHAAGPAQADTIQDIGKLLRQGQAAQALEQVDKYLAGKPKDAQGRFLKGLILTEMNKPTEAISVFQRLTEDFPELPEPYNNLAVIYAQQKQFDKAKQALEMAIRTHPSYATAHENLGDIYARLASQAYDKALQIDSTNTSAQTKLAMIRDLMGGRAAQGAGAGKAAPVVVAAAKPAEVKPVDMSKPAEIKPEAKAEPKPDAKPAQEKPAETKVADAKPPEAAAKAGGDAAGEVGRTVEAWAAAWSRKDVKAYLAHYAPGFKPPGGISRAQWEAERSQRVGKPGAISVTLEGLRVSAEGAGKATARFRQHYKSANLNSSGGKSLLLVLQDGKWLIEQEQVGN